MSVVNPKAIKYKENIMKVIIDGVEYIPTKVLTVEVAEQEEVAALDCDDRELRIGDRVYIRESILPKYKAMGMTMTSREGTLKCVKLTLGHGKEMIGVEFDMPHYDMHSLDGETQLGFGHYFPRNEVRRV